MTNFIKYATLFLFILFSFSSQAQKYTEGSYEFGLISIERTPDSPLDTAMLAMIKEKASEEMSMTIHFSEKVVVMSKKDMLGVEDNLIYDFENKKLYEFKNLMGQDGFTVVDMPNSETPELMEDIDEKIFGLEVVLHEYSFQGMEMTMLITEDIQVEDILEMSPSMPEKGTIVRMTATEQMGMIMTFGMTSFEPKIKDKNIFAIDTFGLVNFTETQNAFAEAFETIAEEDAAALEEYGEPVKGINTEIIQALVDEGALISDNWTGVAYALESKENHDIPSILLRGASSEEGISQLDRKALGDLLKKYDLLSPSIENILNKSDDQWGKISEKNRYHAICLASIKDHLNKKSTKSQFVKNLAHQYDESLSGNPVAEAFVNGTASMEDVMSELKGMQKLETGAAANDQEIFESMEQFFNIASEQMGVPINFERKENVLRINQNGNQHNIDINSYKSYDYSNPDADGNYPYEKTTKINEALYDRLLRVIKQIGADNETNLYYSIYALNYPFTYSIYDHIYEEIISVFPSLKIGTDIIYYQQLEKDDSNPQYDIGMSFPFHPANSEGSELKINNFYNGDSDWGIKYVSTEDKEIFISYLEKHKDSYKIDDETLKYDIDRIRTSLIQGAQTFMDYLPNTLLKVQTVMDGSLRSNFRPTFTEEDNDFKDAYRNLYRYIGDDFEATNFSYDKENHKIHFTYNGKDEMVDPGDQHMVSFISKNMRETKSGKKLYPSFRFSLSEKTYYYMSPEQKEELEAVLKEKL